MMAHWAACEATPRTPLRRPQIRVTPPPWPDPKRVARAPRLGWRQGFGAPSLNSNGEMPAEDGDNAPRGQWSCHLGSSFAPEDWDPVRGFRPWHCDAPSAALGKRSIAGSCQPPIGRKVFGLFSSAGWHRRISHMRHLGNRCAERRGAGQSGR